MFYRLVLYISAVDGELVDNIKVFNHIGEFVKTDLAVEVFVCLYNGSIDQLLQLHIIQVISNHHFEDHEQLSIRDKSIVINIINLESKSKLLLLGATSWQWVQSLYKF